MRIIKSYLPRLSADKYNSFNAKIRKAMDRLLETPKTVNDFVLHIHFLTVPCPPLPVQLSDNAKQAGCGVRQCALLLIGRASWQAMEGKRKEMDKEYDEVTSYYELMTDFEIPVSVPCLGPLPRALPSRRRAPYSGVLLACRCRPSSWLPSEQWRATSTR